MFPYTGILGLSPDVNGDNYLTLGVPLPQHLKNIGKISKAYVGIDMKKDPSAQSTLTLGKFDTSKFRNKSEKFENLKWFKVPRDTTRFAWRHEMKNVFYAFESFDDGFVNEAVFDSFVEGIHLPLNEWKVMISRIQKNLTDQKKNYLICDTTTNYACYYQGECKFNKDDWKEIDFNFIDDRAYEVLPENYLLDAKDEDGFNICNVGLYGNGKNASEYILGDVFMQSMYVMLDYENSAFALNGRYVPVSKIGEKRPRDDGTDSGSGSTLWIIIGVVAAVLVLAGVIGFIIVRQKNRRLQANLAKYE